MWCLARLLPIIIGHRVPEDDNHWENFVLLLSITDMVSAPVLSTHCAAYLRELICEHHENFKTLYPTCSVIPKVHYMIHYPECIERFGPLVHFWCMRFEVKHSHFKDLVQRVKCYKNIPKTLARRRQHMMSCTFGTASLSTSPFGKYVSIGVATLCVASSYKYKDQVLEVVPDEENFRKLTKNNNNLSWIEMLGTRYVLGSVVMVDTDLLPVFGVIKDIIINEMHCYYFILVIFHTVCFLPHFHSHEVVHHTPLLFKLIKPSDLLDHSALSLYKIPRSNSYFVTLKYYVTEKI